MIYLYINNNDLAIKNFINKSPIIYQKKKSLERQKSLKLFGIAVCQKKSLAHLKL